MNLPADPNVFKAQATATYASISEQVEDVKAANAQMRSDIQGLLNEVKKRREAIAHNEANLRKLKRRRAIIARAHFALEQVDEE